MVAVTKAETNDELLTIGRFARLAGLSIGALRHYDELDLLRPARVDRFTGYRGYRADQIGRAQTIARLRDLEMPLEEIREVLEADDPVRRRAVLAAHRSRIAARADRLHFVLHQLRMLIDPKEATVTDAPPLPPEVDATTRRALAVGLFNQVWRLLETADRTREQDDEMLNAAHASRYHWGEVPTHERTNLAIGEWQIARVYCVLGRGEPALHHARRCLDHVEAGESAIWLRASAYEGLARASAVAGDLTEAVRWKAKAVEEIAREPEQDEREVIEQDIATLPV